MTKQLNEPLTAPASHSCNMDATTHRIKERARQLPWLLRSYDGAAVARDASRELLEGWESLNEVMITALYSTMVVHYGRLFSTTSSGRKAPEKRVRQEPRFDADIHAMLLAVRDKLIAHSDREAATGAFNIVLRTISGGGITVTAPSELLVRVIGVAGPINYATAQRVHDHCTVVAAHFERVVRNEALVLAEHAIADVEKFMDAFGGSAAFDKHPEKEITLDATKTVQFPKVPIRPLQTPIQEVRPDLHAFRGSVMLVRPKAVIPVPGRSGEFAKLNSLVPDEEIVKLESGPIPDPGC